MSRSKNKLGFPASLANLSVRSLNLISVWDLTLIKSTCKFFSLINVMIKFFSCLLFYFKHVHAVSVPWLANLTNKVISSMVA